MDVVRLQFGCSTRPFYHGLPSTSATSLKRHDATHFHISGYHNALTVKGGGRRMAIHCEKAQEENEERKEKINVVVGGKKGSVRLRLARRGCKHRPFYRVVATDSKAKRDGRHLEILGYYNPLTGKDGGKRMGINFERTKYWLSVGAQPSDTLQRLLFRAGMLSSPPTSAFQMPTGPRDKRIICEIKGVTSSTEQPCEIKDVTSSTEQPSEIKGVTSSTEQPSEIKGVTSSTEQPSEIKGVTSSTEQP